MKPSRPRRGPQRPLPSPGSALERARREAADAAAAVAARSHARLTELMRAQPTARLTALEDPDLLPSDRATLRRSLQAELRRSVRNQLVPRRWLRPIVQRLPRWRGPLIKLAVTGLGAGVFLGLASAQNAELALLLSPTSTILVYPDGTREPIELASSVMMVRHLNATQAEARWWSPAEGYRTAVLPLSGLYFSHTNGR